MQNDRDNSPKKPVSEGDAYVAALMKRRAELRASGFPNLVALGTAELELRIASWPKEWGDDLYVLIYGDFDAPDHVLEYPALGITVEAGNRTNTIIKTALCVIKARVKVSDKSVSAVLDAAARLNTFLGLWSFGLGR